MDEVINDRLLSYWFLHQLFTGHVTGDHFINFRVIHNERPVVNEKTGRIVAATKAITSIVCPALGMRIAYCKEGGIFDQLKVLNEDPEHPSNIYHSMSPRILGSNKLEKASCIGFVNFFLDQDVGPQWSLEERWEQIAYWHAAGFGPSIVVGSGRGLQPIWLLKARIDTELGEPILKRMVEITGCKGKGNCWDVTRILRTPGFLNQKKWFEHDSPKATILYPDTKTIVETTTALLPRYDWETFKEFPLSGKENIAEVVRQAKALEGDYYQNLRRLARSVADHQNNALIRQAGDIVAQKQPTPVIDLEAKKTAPVFAPIFHLVPDDLDCIPLPNKVKTWFNLYCRKGADGLTQKQQLKLCEKLNITELNPSEMDAKVVFQLVKCRYSFEAIEKFWARPDLRLYREEKMASNPNYLRMTYDKMLHLHTSAMTQAEQFKLSRAEGIHGSIFINEDGYICIQRSRENFCIVLTGNMSLTERYYDLDEPVEGQQEYLHLTVTDAKKRKTAWMVQRIAFASLKRFKEICKDNIFVFTNRDSDLQELLHYLIFAAGDNVIEGKFHSNIKYVGETNEMVFPNYSIGSKDISFCNNPEMLKLMTKNLPLCRLWLNSKPSQEDAYAEFTRIWPSILRMHSPKMIMACLGTIATIAMRQLFHYHKGVDINVPTVNIRGSSCSGKTESAYQLYRLTGCVNPQENRLGASSSMFGMGKMIEIFKSIPLVVDEFKEEDDGVGKNKHMQNVRELVRRIYSGETIAKGRADMSLHRSALKAALWVLGESMLERAGHLAELTRIFPVNTDDWDTVKSREHFSAVRSSKIEMIGPYFYQHMLQLDITGEWHKFIALESHYATVLESHFGRLANRIATNITCIVYGIQLWDKFAQHVNRKNEKMQNLYDIEDETSTYLINQANKSGSIITTTASNGQKIVRERDEALVFLDYLGKMVLNKDKIIQDMDDKYTPCYDITDDRTAIYVYPFLAYDAYRQYCLRLHYQTFEKTTISHRLQSAFTRNETWILETDVFYAAKGRAPQLAWKFDLAILRSMGVWPQPIEDLEPPADPILADLS